RNNGRTPVGSAMWRRSRKYLNPRSRDFSVRFGIHLRSLVDERKMGTGDFLNALREQDLDVTIEAVKKWLSGDRHPRLRDLERIASALGLSEYPHLLPPPV